MKIKKTLKFVFTSFILIVSLIIASMIAMVFYDRSQSFITTDYNLYLSNGTYFEQTASLVMPSKTLLDRSELVRYQYEYNHSSLLGDNITLHLSVIFSDDDFNDMVNALAEQNAESLRETFYYDGNLYYGYKFYNNAPDNVNAYAMAYSIDSDTKKITYVLHESFDCQVMSAKDALSYVLE